MKSRACFPTLVLGRFSKLSCADPLVLNSVRGVAISPFQIASERTDITVTLGAVRMMGAYVTSRFMLVQSV